MHKYLRAIGFSDIRKRKELQELVTDVIMTAEERSYILSRDGNSILAQFCKDFTENVGIAVCGEFEEDDKFYYNYYCPYMRGSVISSYEDITVERHSCRESYTGACDEIRLGVSLIFYLNNMIPYLKAHNDQLLPINGTSLSLSGLSIQGSILMPIEKNEKDRRILKEASRERNHLIAAARMGDEDAIESLTIEDMDTYSAISKKIHTEDVFSLVDTYFMPYGMESDHYSILGEILDVKKVKNSMTEEELWQMTINCNDLEFDLCIHTEDLYGEPEIGRRFKGVVWLQGYINFP